MEVVYSKVNLWTLFYVMSQSGESCIMEVEIKSQKIDSWDDVEGVDLHL